MKKVTVFCTFGRTVDIPEEIQDDINKIEEWADEIIGSDEMLFDVSDSGILSIEE